MDLIGNIVLLPIITIEETWTHVKDQIHRSAKKYCGVVKAGRREIETCAWMWIEEVKDAIGRFHGINDSAGKLTNDKKIVCEIWRIHYEMISTNKFPQPPILCINPALGPMGEINKEELTAALNNSRPKKATGTNNIPSKLWKSSCWQPVELLTAFLNRILGGRQMPRDWAGSVTVHIWKQK
ncbi:hypothetical protein GJ496_010503, partial [Pomphorhynchus laevis]